MRSANSIDLQRLSLLTLVIHSKLQRVRDMEQDKEQHGYRALD